MSRRAVVRRGPLPFGVGIGELFRAGFSGYRRNLAVLTGAGLLTLGTFAAFRWLAHLAGSAGSAAASFGLDLAGLILASTISHPWHCYALAADCGEPLALGDPWRRADRFWAQFVVSFWFWAAFLFGLRYLLGLPSILVTMLYGFAGFVVADSDARGWAALGHSVRLGQGRRVGIAGIAVLMLLLASVGLLPLGFWLDASPANDATAAASTSSGTVPPLALLVTVATLTVTTSIVMVMGARLYRTVAKGRQL